MNIGNLIDSWELGEPHTSGFYCISTSLRYDMDPPKGATGKIGFLTGQGNVPLAFFRKSVPHNTRVHQPEDLPVDCLRIPAIISSVGVVGKVDTIVYSSEEVVGLRVYVPSFANFNEGKNAGRDDWRFFKKTEEVHVPEHTGSFHDLMLLGTSRILDYKDIYWLDEANWDFFYNQIHRWNAQRPTRDERLKSSNSWVVIG